LVDRQELLMFPDQPSAIAALEAGQVDIVSNVGKQYLQNAPVRGLSVVSATALSTHFVAMSTTVKPFDDVRVRQAVRLLLDVEAGVREAVPDARPARSLTPPGLPSFDEGAPAPLVDVERARQLLKEAGHESGLRLTCYSSQRNEALPPSFLRPFKDAGVEVRTETVPNDEFNRRITTGTVGLFFAGWVADFPDADNFLYFLLNSRAQGYFNLGYRSEALDRLTDEARATVDPDQRIALYRKAEAVLREEAPLVPLYHERTYAAVRPNVHALRLRLTPPQLRTEDVWVDEE
jgi:ABC-type transport system substrate-binding protein